MFVLSRFARSDSGNIGMFFALSLFPIMGIAGSAVDYSRASNERTQLQTVTDRAALAATGASTSNDQERINLAGRFFANGDQHTVAVNGRSVTVTGTRTVKTAILDVIGLSSIPVSARSTAVRVNNGPPVCVLALSRTAKAAVSFAGNSTFVAEACAVHSNSSAADALSISGSASVSAAGFCAYGGVSAPSSLVPKPERNCERQEDPFRNLSQPVAGGCNGSNRNVRVQPNERVTLQAGTYCNGLDLKGTVTLQPGLYIIKDGPLSISSQAVVKGEGVTFYLMGSGAGFTLNGGGAVALSAMTSGPYEGILIVQDRASGIGTENKISGNAGTALKGAVYTPTQTLSVTGSSTFGQASPFMPIIADQIHYSGNTTARMDLTAVKTVAPIPLSYTSARLSQ